MQTKLPPQPQEFPMEPDLVSLIESKSFTADQQAFIKKAIQDFRN